LRQNTVASFVVTDWNREATSAGNSWNGLPVSGSISVLAMMRRVGAVLLERRAVRLKPGRKKRSAQTGFSKNPVKVRQQH
jgi:hypothetical protein